MTQYTELRRELETLTTEAFRPELADIDRLPTAGDRPAHERGGRHRPAAVAAAAPRSPPRSTAIADADGARRPPDLRRRGHRRAARRARRQRVPADLQHRPRREVVGLIAGGPEAMVTSIEGAEDSRELAAADLDALGLTADDTVVGISASAAAPPYAVGAVEHARRGAR